MPASQMPSQQIPPSAPPLSTMVTPQPSNATLPGYPVINSTPMQEYSLQPQASQPTMMPQPSEPYLPQMYDTPQMQEYSLPAQSSQLQLMPSPSELYIYPLHSRPKLPVYSSVPPTTVPQTTQPQYSMTAQLSVPAVVWEYLQCYPIS